MSITDPAPLVFIDTETTGVHPGRLAWEIAMVRRDPDGRETTTLLQIDPIDLSAADPFGLRVGQFYTRHASATRDPLPEGCRVVDEETAAGIVERVTRGAHLVGAVPAFDAGTLDPMLRRHGHLPAWHYHLVDVEALAVGALAAQGLAVSPPWSSSDLTEALGVIPASQEERHTALGDALWAARVYDAVMGARRG
jgi:hypothetical protein